MLECKCSKPRGCNEQIINSNIENSSIELYVVLNINKMSGREKHTSRHYGQQVICAEFIHLHSYSFCFNSSTWELSKATYWQILSIHFITSFSFFVLIKMSILMFMGLYKRTNSTP